MVKLEINNQTTFRIPKKPLFKILNKARRRLKIKKSQTVSLAFVSPKIISALNKIYCKKNRATDVLSFEEKVEKGDLGEIIICPWQAKKQAREFKNTFQNEIARLLLHGYLHLLGYDHVKKKEAEKMEKIEKSLL